MSSLAKPSKQAPSKEHRRREMLAFEPVHRAGKRDRERVRQTDRQTGMEAEKDREMQRERLRS